MFKKTAILIAALAVSAPAFADRGHRHGHQGHAYGHYKQRHVVHHHYRPAPRPAVVHHYYRPAPRPVYVVQRPEPVLPFLVGAVFGAAIVHHAVTGY